VVAYLDRISSATLILLPMMVLVDMGIVLLCAGLLRARVVPAWAPWLAIAMSPTTWATYGSVPAGSPERMPVDV
jgi:hypothetical protein